MEQEKIRRAFQDIKIDSYLAIKEHNEGEYTDEEKQWNQQHWTGVIIGAETMMKKLLNKPINYFSFDK